MKSRAPTELSHIMELLRIATNFIIIWQIQTCHRKMNKKILKMAAVVWKIYLTYIRIEWKRSTRKLSCFFLSTNYSIVYKSLYFHDDIFSSVININSILINWTRYCDKYVERIQINCSIFWKTPKPEKIRKVQRTIRNYNYLKWIKFEERLMKRRNDREQEVEKQIVKYNRRVEKGTREFDIFFSSCCYV